jgi:hypothetical protein
MRYLVVFVIGAAAMYVSESALLAGAAVFAGVLLLRQ